MFLTGCGALLVGSVGLTVWWIYSKLFMINYFRQGGGGGACALPTNGNSPGLILPPSPNQRAALLTVPRLLRQASFMKDEESGKMIDPTSYELGNRRSD